MASRILSRLATPAPSLARTFRTSAPRFAEPVITTTPAPIAVRKPVGGFRGGIFGFLAGATSAGAGLYYYVIDDYKVSNELLTEDIYALQSAVQRIEAYVQGLESQISAIQKKSQ